MPRITIIRLRKPEKKNINEELQWFGGSIGLFNKRDRNKSCFRIFIVLVKSLKSDDRLTSDEIAEKANLSRGTVVHHLNKLIDSGFVVSERNRYVLRVENMKHMIEDLRINLNKSLDELSEVANDIDDELNL